jgi:hypothetical protein
MPRSGYISITPGGARGAAGWSKTNSPAPEWAEHFHKESLLNPCQGSVSVDCLNHRLHRWLFKLSPFRTFPLPAEPCHFDAGEISVVPLFSHRLTQKFLLRWFSILTTASKTYATEWLYLNNPRWSSRSRGIKAKPTPQPRSGLNTFIKNICWTPVRVLFLSIALTTGSTGGYSN